MKGASPPGLRVIYAIVFLGFAAIALAGTHPELLHLWRALTRSYSSGTPPNPIACASGLLAAAMAVAIAARVALGRAVQLSVSMLVMLAFVGSLIMLTHEQKQRSVPGANLACLSLAAKLHERLNRKLQDHGGIDDPDEALQGVLDGSSPFYQRPFRALPWHLEKVSRTDVLPAGAQPGWFLLEVDPSHAAFVMTAVGIDDAGGPALLLTEGKPIEYRGAYNPDMAQ